MRPELQSALIQARTLPASDLPELLGELEQIRCSALVRLAAPAPQPAQPDELLGVRETARRLGVAEGYLYRHHAKLAFTRRIGRKLLFSSLGLAQHLKKRT